MDDEFKISPLAVIVIVVTAVLGYHVFGYIEAWVVETLCREVLRCG